MEGILTLALKRIRDTVRDLLPIVLVVSVFQIFVLRQPVPDLAGILTGAFLVMLGMILFIQGLEMGLFPIGEGLAYAFASKGSVFWLIVFGFCLGFATTVAEPALIAIANEAAKVASEARLLAPGKEAMDSYAQGLRFAVALSVGTSIAVGVFRIIKGWPIHNFIIVGYIVVSVMTIFAPVEIVGIAYDSGGVTTSTVTVPLVAALGVGLASSIQGRNPMIDGFGLIALASLFPMIFVMGYGMLVFGMAGGN